MNLNEISKRIRGENKKNEAFKNGKNRKLDSDGFL